MKSDVPPAARRAVLGVLVAVMVATIAVGVALDDDDSASSVGSGDGARPESTVGATDASAPADPDGDGDDAGDDRTTEDASRRPVGASTSVSTTTTTVFPLAVDDGLSSDARQLVEAFEVEDPDLQPKSVVASGNGVIVAQNMMYRHNVSMFDRSGGKLASIDDAVDLSEFGIDDGPLVQGSPVEAAFMPDGRHVYVSNYKMYGDGYNPVADDNCDRGDWDDSFVYRINVRSRRIDRVITTGAVPKFMAVTPDGSRLLVSNWCGFDVSIIDTATNTEITRVDVGRHPRGIAITADSSTAYVAVMGEARIVRLDIAAGSLSGEVPNAGQSPRHLVLSPDDRYLYVSNNLENLVRKIDLASGVVAASVSTGTQPRSMSIAEDGASLYVVNYEDGTMSKVRTSDMGVLQTLATGYHPVGITYDPATRQVWVANYAGSLSVFVDQAPRAGR